MATPAGWSWLGPVVGDPAHGSVELDVDTCAVHLAVVDLDAGAYAHDVRAARVWDGKAWSWADDWVVRDGLLLRPGLRSIPQAAWPEALETDSQGRVVARVSAGRRVEVLRGDDGRFRGMRSGRASVELDPEGATSDGGRRVTYTYSGTRIDAVEGPLGRVQYEYDGAGLRGVKWPDGGRLRVEADGTSGLGGRWKCDRTGTSTAVDDGAGRRWTVVRDGNATTTTDPAGARMRLDSLGGRITGWEDADGARAQLRWGQDGRPEALVQGGATVANFRWSGAEMVELRDAAQGVWRLATTGDGVQTRTEPDGRSVRRELTDGGVRVWTRGGESARVLRDGNGRPVSLQVGSHSEVRLERDAAGEVVRVLDAVGGTWQVERTAASVPTAIVDPAGTRWELRVDASGHLVSLTRPDGQRVSLVRSEGRLAQLTHGAVRWSWLRDSAGRLAGVRDPAGALTSFTRDSAGRVATVRSPDGSSFTIGRDTLGRVRSVGAWRLARDAAGRVLEVRDAAGALAGWSRDDRGRVTGFGMGDIAFAITRDAAGRVSDVRAGDEGGERWRIERDAAGRVSSVTTADGRTASLLRDGAGLVSRITDELGITNLSRDLRGRISRVTADRTWAVGRDGLGRVVRVEVPGVGVTGADYEPDGGLSLLRLSDGTLVRRNVSGDAGELLATDRDGRPTGDASWTLDDAGRLLTLAAGGAVRLERDPRGLLVGLLGPDGEWRRDAGRLSLPDGSAITLDQADRPTAATLSAAGPWGLEAGAASYRWTEGGTLGGIDGETSGAVLVHDGLGRPAVLTLGERAVPLLRDAFGRLRRVGTDVLVGWDALLGVGDASRAPMSPEAVGRPGSAVLFDPRGYPLMVPWVGALRPWPGGWLRGVDAAEAGPGGRYALPGGILVDLLRAVDPLSGQTTAPDRWPWTPKDMELSPAPSPFRAPDGATDAFWDAAAFDPPVGWADGAARLVEAGVLPGGAPEPEEAPGLPWLPASFARTVPAPFAGLGGAPLDEDVAGQLVVSAALRASPMDSGTIIFAFISSELDNDRVDTPGFSVPSPALGGSALADSPFGH